MKKFSIAVVSFAMAATAIPIATPAIAQGSVGPIKRLTMCPDGYSPEFGVKDGMCYPGKSAPNVYIPQNKGSCANGYRPNGPYCTDKPASDGVSAADKLVSYGTITKANRLDRCPLGYFSKSDMSVCTTRLSPAPKSRNKKGACNSNEIDEWGLYCTANANSITREQAVMEADRDFNAIYSANRANYPNQGNETENYPSMVAAYGSKGGKAANNTSSSNAADESGQNAQCQPGGDGSASGAAIGGAVAGEAGAVLGSVLGGLGKKKKKKPEGC